jgi:hypothetical protein
MRTEHGRPLPCPSAPCSLPAMHVQFADPRGARHRRHRSPLRRNPSPTVLTSRLDAAAESPHVGRYIGPPGECHASGILAAPGQGLTAPHHPGTIRTPCPPRVRESSRHGTGCAGRTKVAGRCTGRLPRHCHYKPTLIIYLTGRHRKQLGRLRNVTPQKALPHDASPFKAAQLWGAHEAPSPGSTKRQLSTCPYGSRHTRPLARWVKAQ